MMHCIVGTCLVEREPGLKKYRKHLQQIEFYWCLLLIDISFYLERKQLLEIDFGYIFRDSTKPVWKGTRIESIEDGLKEYEEMLKEGWKQTNLYRRNF